MGVARARPPVEGMESTLGAFLSETLSKEWRYPSTDVDNLAGLEGAKQSCYDLVGRVLVVVVDEVKDQQRSLIDPS